MWPEVEIDFTRGGRKSQTSDAQGASRDLNPSLSERVVAHAYERDPLAPAEHGGLFRTDVENFISREIVDACIVEGRFELLPASSIYYRGFADPSGGSSDSFPSRPITRGPRSCTRTLARRKNSTISWTAIGDEVAGEHWPCGSERTMLIASWIQLQLTYVPIMFAAMTATPFDLDAPLGQRRAIIRRDADGVEMVELAWGLRPGPNANRPFTVVRAENRTISRASGGRRSRIGRRPMQS